MLTLASSLLSQPAMRHLLLSLLTSLVLVPASARADHDITVASDPVALVAGTYTLSAARAIGSRVAVRVDGEATPDLPGFGGQTWRAGVSLPLYLERAFHGPFIEPGVVTGSYLTGLGLTEGTEDMPHGAVRAITERLSGPRVFVGWHWMFGSGLHVAAAVGASRSWPGAREVPVRSRESYLRVGIAF
jgi:hypothetical protein